MNLTNIKECSKCANSLVYGTSDNKTIQCISDNYIAKELFSKDGRSCAKFCRCFTPSKKERSGKIEQDIALKFILAGNSDFILHSTKTNDDFRFILNIKECKDKPGSFIYFVNIVKANDTIYCGLIWFDKDIKEFKYAQGKRGRLHGTSIEIRSLLFVLNKLYNNDTVNNLEVYSLGKCGYCGKIIEINSDIEIGIHKNCISKIHLDSVINDN